MDIVAWRQAMVAVTTTPPGPATNQQVAASQKTARYGARWRRIAGI